MSGHLIGGTVFYSNSPTAAAPRQAKVKKFKPKFLLEVERGRCLQGWVTHIDNPFHYYIQFTDRKTIKYLEMVTELNSQAASASAAENPQIGHPYAAKEADQWFRVLLEKMTPFGLAAILFIDTGRRDVVQVSKLYNLDPRFMAVPAQAVLCQLANVISPGPWAARTTQHFKELVDNKFVDVFSLQTYVGEVGRVNKQEAKLVVTMYTNNDEKSINSKMVDLGVCTGIGPMEEPWHLDSRMPVRLSDHQLVPSAMREQIAELLKSVGKEESLPEVYVSAVVDPGQFYVHHRSEDSQKLHSSLVDKLAPQLPKADNVVIGELYLVQDHVSKQWFRGKCIKKSGRTPVTNRAIYDFFLIDDGSTIKVAASTVRVINDSLKKFTPMIWECSLKLEKPENGWNKTTVDLFKKHALQKKFQMSIISICNEIRTVDLHPISDDPNGKLQSITETMQAALAEVKEEKVHVPAPIIEKYTIRDAHIFKGTQLSGKVALVNSPDDFFVRFDESDAFWSFNTLLQQEYDQCHTWNSFKIVTVEKGRPFVIRHEGSWQRVLIEEIISVSESMAYFVDTGLRSAVSSKQLLPIQDRFLEFPVVTFPCKLYGVCTKTPSGMWPEEPQNAFKALISDTEVTIFIEGTLSWPKNLENVPGQNLPLPVVLYRGSDCESINKQFTSQGHGISVREHDMACHNRFRSSSPSEQSSSPLYSAASEVSEPSSASRKVSLAESCSSGLSVKTNLSSDCQDKSYRTLALSCVDLLLTGRKIESQERGCLTRKDSVGEIFVSEVDTLECVEFKELIGRSKELGGLPPDGSYVVAAKFLMCQSPDAIFFRPLKYEAKYHQMMSDMQKSYRSSKVDPISTFDVGSRCAAFVYGHWIRIIIKEFDANLHCLAIDMDNGQPHELSASKIYPLVSPFDTVPKLALKCSMLGLVNKINLAMVSDIASALLQAEEIYLSCPQRPKAIPPIFAATIHYAQSDDKGKTLINMNSQLSV